MVKFKDTVNAIPQSDTVVKSEVNIELRMFESLMNKSILAYRFDANMLSAMTEEKEKKLNVIYINDRIELLNEISSHKNHILLMPGKFDDEEALELLKLVRDRSMDIKILLIVNSFISRWELVTFMKFKLNSVIFNLNYQNLLKTVRHISI